MKQESWRYTKTKERENALRKFQELLKTSKFSKTIDIILGLANDRIKQKDEIRRRIQAELSAFRFIPEDFVWRAK